MDSNFRQVPDHQEVWVDSNPLAATEPVSIVIEILELDSSATLNEMAVNHLAQIIGGNANIQPVRNFDESKAMLSQSG
jgi:hypothetical protein